MEQLHAAQQHAASLQERPTASQSSGRSSTADSHGAGDGYEGYEDYEPFEPP